VPNGYIKDVTTGNCIKSIGGKGGQVLGSSTQLPNTGANALLNVVSGLALITLALGARLAGRQQIKQM
jgi:LPXTG-motif cell wall-anchored protein